MKREGEQNVFVLPDSQITFTFTSAYSPEAMANLVRDMVRDPELARRFRDNLQETLARVGIQVLSKDSRRITDEDVLVALGHRRAEGRASGQSRILGQGPQYIVAVAVVAAIFQGSSNLPAPEDEQKVTVS
ncbi:MAG: hypothetical protein K6U11_10490 [bacterium]|nr:hypothetical protein [bacterium]